MTEYILHPVIFMNWTSNCAGQKQNKIPTLIFPISTKSSVILCSV